MMPVLADVLARLGEDGAKDLFRRLLQEALQQLIDTELTTAIGALLSRFDERSQHYELLGSHHP